MDYAFASLAHIRILLLPIGTIQPATFENLASEIGQFVEIRLGDIPADSRDDRARFMPNPLATGSLFLNYIRHPPSQYLSSLNLFRPSDFPLGVIGVASCTQTDILSSIYSQFVGLVAELLPSTSVYPLARRCFVFEEGDGNTNLNVGNNLPGLVVIPSMMGNKKLYIGTLLAELCSNILGEFSIIVKELESLTGDEYLYSGIFGKIPNYKAASEGRPSLDSSSNSFPQNNPIGTNRASNPRLNMRRASTLGPGIANNRNSQLLAPSSSKKRPNAVGTGSLSHTRLYKVLGDFFLLSGRTMDASIWYNEAVHSLKQPQDMPWQASALEGIVVAGVIDCWLSGHSFNNQPKDSISEFLDKLSRAGLLYSGSAEAPELEGSISELSLLYISSCFRYCSLLYHMWTADTISSFSFDFLLHGKMDPKTIASMKNSNTQMDQKNPGTSRSEVSAALNLAHGPWILHLGPRERINSLKYMARIYSNLHYRRKETYILRELLACIMDLIVQGREEYRGKSESETEKITPGSSAGDVAIRESDENTGNSGVLQLIAYVCKVHGVDLRSVGFAKDLDSKQPSQPCKTQLSHTLRQKALMTRYTWTELQVGLIREALAIAESLPDYPSVAQFASSAIQELHLLLDADDQYHFHTVSSRAMATIRRRGDDRKLKYWLEELVNNIRFIPPPFVKMPSERVWPGLQANGTSNGGQGYGPFLYNPRRMTVNKRQAYAVANEILEFVVTLVNPYHISLEITQIELSTMGVPFIGKPQSIVLQGTSTENLTLAGRASESGTLVVRGCKVSLPGIEHHETLLPILSEEEEEKTLLDAITLINEKERRKPSSLMEKWDKNKFSDPISSERSSKPPVPPRYLELRIVPEQPTLRIRRTSLSNGAVMLYEGESSLIRLTVENISSLPIDYMDLTFEDSTKNTLEQYLTRELDAFDTYETEYSLVKRPVFSWDSEIHQKTISPGKECTLLVRCYGKSDCTDGTIQITYSYAHQLQGDKKEAPTSFYTRQLLYPVIVTVYQMLECTGLNIVPFSQLSLYDKDINTDWRKLFERIDDYGWCLLILDVQNMYGLPFEVSLSANNELSQSKVIPPGANFRLLLPVRRFSLPENLTTQPIPSLTNRQFVVTGLKHNEDDLQRVLFWYREELLKRVQASWKEVRKNASGSRTGELSLRQQRFTMPMLNALREDEIRVALSLLEDPREEITCDSSGVTVPNTYVGVVVRVQNLRPSSIVLSLTISVDPADHVALHGALKDIPLGRLQRDETKEYHAILIFVSKGQYTIQAEVRSIVIGEEANVCGTGDLRVTIRA